MVAARENGADCALQLCYATPAFLLTWCLHGRQYNPVPYWAAGGGANQLFAPTTAAGGWCMEAVLTFALVYVVLSSTDSKRAIDAPHLPVRIPPCCTRAVRTLLGATAALCRTVSLQKQRSVRVCFSRCALHAAAESLSGRRVLRPRVLAANGALLCQPTPAAGHAALPGAAHLLRGLLL